jgi:hypothetical protein
MMVTGNASGYGAMGWGTEDAPMPQKKAGWHHGGAVNLVHATRDSMTIVNECI